MQIKDSFDVITKNNIVRGAFHTFVTSAIIAGSLALFSFLGHQDYGNPAITMIVCQFSGMLYNTLKEYAKGDTTV